MSKLLVPIAAVVLLAVCAHADVYMQYPRGSNNRLSEANRDRESNNRLFDSQNNNRGGYNAGQVYFYTGTVMNIEWTNQHSCGGPHNHCEMILQYTCDDLIRDGSTTTQIPTNAGPGVDTNPKFGRHESYASYTQGCLYRSRNKGLFTSNRNLQGNAATFTRQNENGAASGFECPEERDYYPYWHPTMWRDIAILTNQPQRCAQYTAESQNVKGRWYCQAPSDWVTYMASMGATGFIPINATECVQIQARYLVDSNNNTLTGQWVYQNPWNTDAPFCSGNQFTRENHLGNLDTGFPAGYNWTIPDSLVSERCVLRLRYNISTGDYAGWDDWTSIQAPTNLTNLNNSLANPTSNKDPARIDIWSKYGLQWTDVNVSFSRSTNNPNGAAIKNSRDYVLKDDPRVDIFGDALIPRTSTTAPKMVRLQLAVNTNQFGRTFEDRSHRFAIRARPSNLNGVRIHNVQVKGKRGNIVQVFPATEYDFWPKRLKVALGDYVHFQWTGSNNNDDNNAGRGKAGTDRHNILLLRGPVFPYVSNALAAADATNEAATFGVLGSTYPTRIDAGNATFIGLGAADLKMLATFTTSQMGGDLDQGDDAGTYFDLGPRPASLKGIFNYACSRNNDFSNRDQKATIIVGSSTSDSQAFSVSQGKLTTYSGAELSVSDNAFTGTVQITIMTSDKSAVSTFSGHVASNYYTIAPGAKCGPNVPTPCLPLADGATMHLKIPYDNKPLVIPSLYHSDNINGNSWSSVSASFSGGYAQANVDQGGTYVVQTEVNWGGVVGVIVGVLGFVGIVVGGLYWRYKRNLAGGADTKATDAPKV